ncbi:MAG: peptidoglycan DD-metalloendopeptidase family protein [Chlorobi bacterium]|nr:peptidoglycan DD-metalloendopeptidase family protein [Chlorobiota bacterium]
MKALPKIKLFYSSVLNSYSQIFFSENKLFAGLLLIVSFLDFWAGIFGLISVLTANITANILGYYKLSIKKGLYGFNALLVGLGTGIIFKPSIELTVVIIFAALLTFFITIALEGFFAKYALPYLSIPFLLGIWAVILATKDFSALGLSERSIYTYNELYALGGKNLVNLYDWFNNIQGFQSLKIYFLSLGAIFFQNNILAGIIIALGLLYYSRIAFSLSVIGFWSAYFFYQLIGADFSALAYTFIGFNYILTSIAVGGYFVIPSGKSYFWTLILLPITVILTASLGHVFTVWQISIYSLPFNIIVLLFIYVLKLRFNKHNKLTDTFTRQATPEQNLYLYNTAAEEFKNKNFYPINLPFKGDWTVTQAHNGKYTHKDKWRHAWDFVIKDDEGKQYSDTGDFCKEYFCYEKPVYAPAGGFVSEISDNIPDNKIGDINTEQNWGNSIVIKHGEYLFTQISHLKEGSIKIKKGDYVKKGDILAKVGNSGHSPYPHIHFQIQATPYIGSETLDYPIHNFIVKEEKKYELIAFGKPKKEQIVASVTSEKISEHALHFIPGKKLQVFFNEAETEWVIQKDILNQTYIFDKKNKETAYFYENDAGIYFTNFYGNKKSELFLFFNALYNVRKSFYKGTKTTSTIRPDLFFSKPIMFIQDFIAPFYIFLKSKFRLEYLAKDDDFAPDFVKLKSEISKVIFNRVINKMTYDIILYKSGKIEIRFKDDNILSVEPIKKPLN